jgi:predicted ATPase
VLDGEPGAGKTRLAAELGRIVRRDGGRVVSVRATPPEQDIPFSAVATLSRKLLSLPGAGGVSATSELVLHQLVPSLARRTVVPAGQLPAAAPLADAVADLLGAVSFEAPLLLVVDDVQWLDSQSWALLTRLVAQVERDPVLVVLTLRPDEAPAGVARALARLGRQEAPLRVSVLNFSQAEVAEFLAFNAGLTDSGRGEDLVSRLYRASRGNPLFLVECLKAFHDAGALAWHESRWTLDLSRVPADLPLPTRIRTLLLQRLQDVSAGGLAIALALASADRELAYDELRRETDLPDAQVARGLTELVRRGLVTESEDGYGLAHEQLAVALRERGRSQVRRGRRVAVGILIVALLASAGGAVWSRTPAAPLYGGGAVYSVSGDTLIEMIPPVRPVSRLDRTHLPGGGAARFGPHRTLPHTDRTLCLVREHRHHPRAVAIPGGVARRRVGDGVRAP